MFILNNKRINIYASFTTEDGTTYANLTNPEIRDQVGVIELADPVAPEDYSEDTHYRTEQDEAPYVVYTRKSDEQIAQAMMAKAKRARSLAVSEIVVTTQAGNAFDGDEDSQNRMSRAINGMDDGDQIIWVLANNMPAQVSRAELREALRLAGQAQTAVWAAPYSL